MKSKVVEFTTEKLVACIALYAFILITLCVNLVSNSELFYRLRLLSMAAGAMVGLYICLKEGYKKPFIIGAILTAGWVSCMMVQPFSNYTASKMVYTLFFLFFSVILVYKLESLLVSRIIAILTMAVFILHMIRNDSMRDMLLDDSYNYISVLLLFALMSYFISCLHNDKKISIWVCIVFFVICIWAYGRGGILMSGTLVVLVLAANVISENDRNLKILFGILCTGILGFVIALVFSSGVSDMIFGKFVERGLVDMDRIEIWTGFMENSFSSPVNIIFGSDAALIRPEDVNMHNFICQSYASFGLVPTLILLGLMISAIVNMIKQREPYYLILFLVLLLRASTDRLFFQGYCEIYLYYFILKFALPPDMDESAEV